MNNFIRITFIKILQILTYLNQKLKTNSKSNLAKVQVLKMKGKGQGKGKGKGKGLKEMRII